MRIQGLDLMTYSDSSRLDFIPQLQINGRISFWNIRNERTGIHAMVVISVDGRVVMSDLFNIGRATDRDKLVRFTEKNLTDVESAAWES